VRNGKTGQRRQLSHRGTQPQDVFTPEDFSEEHRQIAKTAIEFTTNEVMPAAAEIEAKNFTVTRACCARPANWD
jgi:hypothetical protein